MGIGFNNYYVDEPPQSENISNNYMLGLFSDALVKLEDGSLSQEEKECLIKFRVNWEYIQSMKNDTEDTDDEESEGSIEEDINDAEVEQEDSPYEQEPLEEQEPSRENTQPIRHSISDYLFMGWFVLNNIRRQTLGG